MKRFFLMAAMATSLAFSGAATTPVRAGGSDVAAGLIGGLAAGTIIGAAATAPTLLWTTAGIRGTCAVLLLDARRAGLGWVPGRLDVSRCQSLRITRLAERLQIAKPPALRPAVLPCPPYTRRVSDRVVKLLPHFISDPTILHADGGSPHADWIFERTLLLRQVLRVSL